MAFPLPPFMEVTHSGTRMKTYTNVSMRAHACMQACVHVYVCACEVRSQYEMSLRQGLSMNLDPLISDSPVDLCP